MGPALALANYRERSTTDVDTVTELDQQIRDAVAAVAADVESGAGLTAHWFNDDARAWRPIGMDPVDCEAHYEGHALTVLVPHARWLFLMKLNRSQLVDLADMRALWPHAGFADAASAAHAFVDAYPGEPIDEFMANHIQREVIDHRS